MALKLVLQKTGEVYADTHIKSGLEDKPPTPIEWEPTYCMKNQQKSIERTWKSPSKTHKIDKTIILILTILEFQ